MPSFLARPDLALRGYDLVQSRWDEFGPGEEYLHAKVLAGARPALERARIEADPREAVVRALNAHVNLLSQFEFARAKGWVLATEPAEASRLLVDLLHGGDALDARARRFLAAAGVDRTVDERLVRVNVTVASYLLAMVSPERHAFAKPEAVLQPAALLLCSPSGEPDPGLLRAGRIAFTAALYGEIRDLWARERNFTGDLLDVHSRLWILGSGRFKDCTWAEALTPTILGALVREFEEAHPEYHEAHKAAADLFRHEFLDGAGDDPMSALPLRRYAYGMGRQSFCSVVEGGTRNYIGIRLGNVSGHEVGVASGGTWRLRKKEGFGEEEAVAFYTSEVLPRLAQIQGAAKAFLSGAPVPPITSPRLAAYHSIDGKTFCLLVSGFDYEGARDRLVGVVSAQRLSSLARLIGLGDRMPDRFEDYVTLQRAFGEALDALPPEARPSAQGFAAWTWADPAGIRVMRLIEGGDLPDEGGEGGDEGEGEGEGDDSSKPHPPHGPVPPPPRSWEAFAQALAADSENGVELVPIAQVLASRTNVVLYGPPGTGKTFLSVRIAQAWRRWQNDDATDPTRSTVEQVTFHPSYGYEDFVEAFRPDPAEPGRFRLVPGLLPTLAERAANNPTRRYLLLVDELNRGDVARILGELITLLERDKRDRIHARRRMLSGEPLWLPGNLYVLGTMNTADKSVSLLDVAIRRRFAFVPTPPRPDFLHAGRGLVEEVEGVRLKILLEALNERLLQVGVLPDRLIGHSLLWIKADVDDPAEALAERFRLDIIPLVEEYCFADRHQMGKVLGNLVDERGRPRFLDDEDRSRFLAALRAICTNPRELG